MTKIQKNCNNLLFNQFQEIDINFFIMKKIGILFISLCLLNACGVPEFNDEELVIPEPDLEETDSAEPAEEAEEIEESTTEHSISLKTPNDLANITSLPIIFEGEVSEGAQSVRVTVTVPGEDQPYDDYVLQDFEVGDTEFTYRARPGWDNLKVGNNTYNFIAEFEDGEEAMTELTVNYIYVGEPSLEVSFDRDATELPIIFNGKVSPGVEKVSVYSKHWSKGGMTEDRHQLNDYQAGDTEFTYRAKPEWNNLVIGENEYYFTIHLIDGTTLTKTVYYYYYPNITYLGKGA